MDMDGPHSKFADLRSKAEELLKASAGERSPEISATDILSLIDELEVHQSELEMRNHEFVLSRRELEESRKAYADLYEMAPIGYVTINREGIITRVNGTASVMLHTPQDQLKGSDFSHFILPDDHNTYYRLVRDVPDGGLEKRTGKIRLHSPGTSSFYVRVEIAPCRDASGTLNSWRIVLEDISGDLKAERERLLSILETMPACVYLLAPDYSIKFANRTFLETFGGKEGKHCYELLRGRTGPCEDCDVARSLNTQTARQWEWTAPNQKCFSIHTHPFTDEDGSALILKLSLDISDRKRAEEEARAQKETLEKVFESAPYIMMLVNNEGRVSKINRTCAAFSGRSKEEVVGLLGGEVFNCFHSFNKMGCGRNAECSDCPVRSRVVHTFQTGESIHNVEGSMTIRRGPKDIAVGMLISTVLIKDTGSDLVLISIADITERRQAQKALRESEEQFRTLAESSADCIMRFDRERRHLYVNPTCEKVTGIPAEKFIGKTHGELGFDARQSEECEKKIRKVFDTAESDEWDFEFEGPTGRMYFDWRVVPEFSEDGSVKTVLGVSRDITKRVQAEYALRTSEERYRELTEHLQEANAALKVLLKQREADRTELEESLLKNVKHLITPYLEKLKKSYLSGAQKHFLEIVETHLLEITSPFVHKISAPLLGLTPMEIRVADLIRQGKSTKEIADLLGVSEYAVIFHRQGIRKKLGLTGKKLNLQTYLSTMP